MSGLLSLVRGGGAAGAVVRLPRRRRAPSWAVADPVVELAERLAEACASAVHPDEIAALLESEGLTDEQITERYEHRDLFALAATLFALVPRAYPEPEPAADPWRTDLGRCVLRGLTFALPGVAYVIGGRWAGGADGPFGVSAAVAGWAVAGLCSWGWNQGLAHRAGLLLLAGHRRAAARCLLGGGAAGTVAATAAAVAVTGLAHPSAPAFAAGQALYMAAATTLLVLRRERTLLYVLAPLTPAAACGAADLPSPAVAALLAATAAAAAVAALNAALREADSELPAGAGQDAPARGGPAARLRRLLPAPGLPRRPGRRSRAAGRQARVRDAAAGRGQAAGQVAVARSVPVAVAGFAAGGLVVAAALAGEFVAALTVSMGVAEWLLFRLRSGCLVALRRTGVAERLLARSWRVLGRCLGGYAAALVALAGVESAVLPGAAAWDAPHLGVLLALGCTLWLALLLQSCDRSWTAAAVLSAATATALALLAAHTGTPGAVIGRTGACAAAVLFAAATAATARVTTHR